MSAFIVTGGSAGIGLEIARRFTDDGHDIVIVGRSLDRLQDAQRTLERKGVSCQTAALDVRDADAVSTLVQGLPCVVNNAAGNFASPTVDPSLNGFRAVVEISLYGTFNFSTAVARRLPTEELYVE